MDDINSEREPNNEKSGVSAKNSLLLEETRQAFNQRIAFMRSVDIKAFGVIAIDAVLLSVFSLVLNTLKSPLLLIPYIGIIVSIFFLAKCISPIDWKIMGALKMVQEYGNSEYYEMTKKLIASYVDLDEKLKVKYENNPD